MPSTLNSFEIVLICERIMSLGNSNIFFTALESCEVTVVIQFTQYTFKALATLISH